MTRYTGLLVAQSGSLFRSIPCAPPAVVRRRKRWETITREIERAGMLPVALRVIPEASFGSEEPITTAPDTVFGRVDAREVV